MNCVFKFRRAKRVATLSTTKVVKIEKEKKKIIAQLNAVSHLELAVLNSQDC